MKTFLTILWWAGTLAAVWWVFIRFPDWLDGPDMGDRDDGPDEDGKWGSDD